MNTYRFGKIFFFVVVMAAVVTTVVMALWNWLVPSIFNGPLLSFWQAAGLLILARLLFGRPGWMGKFDRRMEWKRKMENMTPEEREKMKALWRQRCSRSFMKEQENK